MTILQKGFRFPKFSRTFGGCKIRNALNNCKRRNAQYQVGKNELAGIL